MPRHSLQALVRGFHTKPGARDFFEGSRRIDVERHLWTIRFDPVRGCNLYCLMCRDRVDGPHQVAGADVVRRVGEILLPHADDLSMGCKHEALLHPGLAGIVSTFREETARLGHRVHLTVLTSGTLLTPASTAALVRSGLNVLGLSVESANPTTYERIRRPARWQPMRRRIEALVQVARGGSVVVVGLGLIMRSTLQDLEGTVETLAALGVRDLCFRQMLSAPECGQGEVIERAGPLQETMDAAVARAQSAARRLGVRCALPEVAPQPAPDEIFPLLGEGLFWDEGSLARSRPSMCALPWHRLFVDREGFVFPCQFHERPEDAWGNVLTNTFEELVNGDRAMNARAALLDGRPPLPACSACPIRPRPASATD